MSIQELRERIEALASSGPGLTLMEVCGTHTVALFRSGVKTMLPTNIRLVSGPGCPVCVTAQGYIDAACALAREGAYTVVSYGDMLRVPGAGGSLAEARAAGGRVHVVYSARDAVKYATCHMNERVVFLAVGFETTAPATAQALIEAEALGLRNFFVLPGHKLVIPAMEALLSAGDVPLDGFLCPGHVSVIIGSEAYRPLVERYGVACVVGGFEAESMLRGILRLLEMRQAGEAGLDNVYPMAVRPGGNAAARALIERVFTPCDATWRAMGVIPGSGLALCEALRRFDIREREALDIDADTHLGGCRCGEVIQGKLLPPDCAHFGKGCNPISPIGPCMVSSEGTCAAWFKYGRQHRG